MLKRIFIFTFVLFLALSVSAQDNTIKLIVSGEGTTREEATANALRSAIEQSFGTFVSANTQFLNDEVVKEEIATVASGNIKGYQELSCITLPNGGRSVTLAATVSLSNLISYSKSKGSTAEFAGAAFTMNIRMRKLNAENEITALYNMLEQLYILAPSVFDWELEVGEPAVLPELKYKIPMKAKAKINNNTASFFSIIFNTLESLSLSPSEVEGYKANQMKVYTLKVDNREYVLRNDYRTFTTYVEYLINCIGESFHIYGQFGDHNKKLLYDLKKMLLARVKRQYSSDPYTYEIKNLNTFMSGIPGTIAFQRDLSVSLDENTLYQLIGFEVVPAPNISRITFVRKNGMMVVDTMNVYQSVDFEPEVSDRTYRDAFKHMRVLYVSEDCLTEYDDIFFYNQDCLQKITVERCGRRTYNSRGYPVICGCDNLETVRIGKGIRYIDSIENNPKLSTVIFGSTLTYGEDVIDLMALTEKDLQDLQGIIIIGDDVKSIGPSAAFGTRSAPPKKLSVVFNRDIRCDYGIDILPSAKLGIWLNASAPNNFGGIKNATSSACDWLLVPKECLPYFQAKRDYYNPEAIEDKMSELGCLDLLSFLKKVCQSDFSENISEDNDAVIEEVEEEPIPFQLLEEKPSFQGGDVNQFSKWVRENLIYPETAKENGVQGRVTVQARINSDGSLSDIKVLRGCDPELDKEAVRVISLSPKWEPGKQRGRAVPTTYTFPVIFTL